VIIFGRGAPTELSPVLGRPSGKRSWLGDRMGLLDKSVTHGEKRCPAARSYSLIKPNSTGRRLMRLWVRSAMGWVGGGGRRSQPRWGRVPSPSRYSADKLSRA
jgi:hypothetical protein